MLPLETFKTVVESTPLISIDLVVQCPEGKILLGKRTNRPAQGYWFVPGGRIVKDESVKDAFARLIHAELGLSEGDVTAEFLGVYQHFYDDNFSGEPFSTHYVVLAYKVQLLEQLDEFPVEQHSEYQWLTEQELLARDDVHNHSQWYFQKGTEAV